MKIYKVGGFVRDSLLKIPSSDCDYVVVGSTIEEMLSLGFIQVGKSFPVFLHPITNQEYALARKEKKSGTKHNQFNTEFNSEITLAEDLQRRDITINTLCIDEDGKLIDLCGGLNDLQNKIIRHVSLAFIEDPLRILRVARFANKLNFSIASETMALMQQMALDHELANLSYERILKEVIKACNTSNPWIFWQVLEQSNNLVQIFPEIHKILNDTTINSEFKTALSDSHSFEDFICILAISLHKLNHCYLNPYFIKKSIAQQMQFIWQVLDWCTQNKTIDNTYQTIIKTNYHRDPQYYDLMISYITRYSKFFYDDEAILNNLALLNKINQQIAQINPTELINTHLPQNIGKIMLNYKKQIIQNILETNAN